MESSGECSCQEGGVIVAQYENIQQLAAGVKYGSQGTDITEPYVAKSDLGFGKGAFGYEGDPDIVTDVFDDENTITYNIDFVTLNVINVTVNGLAIDPVTFDTDQATTMGLLVAAIAALDPDFTVESAARVVTVRAPGQDIVITGAVTLGATQPTTTIGTAAAADDLVFLGPVVKAQKAPTSAANSVTGYVEDEMLEVMRSGYLTVVVDAIANCVEHLPVYVIVTGTNKGKFTGTSGSNLLLNATFHFLADKAQDLAVVNFQQLPKVVA